MALSKAKLSSLVTYKCRVRTCSFEARDECRKVSPSCFWVKYVCLFFGGGGGGYSLTLNETYHLFLLIPRVTRRWDAKVVTHASITIGPTK
jgi:hypothetical protein